MGCATSQVASVAPVLPSDGVDLPSSKDEQHRHQGREADTCRSPFHEQHVLVARLGKGSYAQVFATRRKFDGRELATKVLDLCAPRKSGGGGESRKRAIDSRARLAADHEVYVLKKIGKQDHCVSLVESFREGRFTYIVMERCSQTLLQALEQAPNLNERFYAGVFRDMLQALDSIHSLRVVHRDVKPDNFLHTGGQHGVVKLCDFGLAKTMKAGTPGLRHCAGTAPFIAPEVLNCEYYDEMVDVWSLGVIAYVLMFGEFPYQPSDMSPKGMREAIRSGAKKPSFKPGLWPSGAESDVVTGPAIDFMARALCRDPALRISAREALQHPWLEQRVPDGVGTPSLRPMLASAKWFGAFSPVAKREDQKGPDPDDTEMQMALMQAKHDSLDLLLGIDVAYQEEGTGSQSVSSAIASMRLSRCGKDGKESASASRSTKASSSRGCCNSVGSSKTTIDLARHLKVGEL